MGLLVAGACAVLLSAILLLIDGRVVDFVGYVLATFVTVLCVAFYRSIDGRRRAQPSYTIPAFVQVIPIKVVTWFGFFW